jgi:hypothetical protein
VLENEDDYAPVGHLIIEKFHLETKKNWLKSQPRLTTGQVYKKMIPKNVDENLLKQTCQQECKIQVGNSSAGYLQIFATCTSTKHDAHMQTRALLHMIQGI